MGPEPKKLAQNFFNVLPSASTVLVLRLERWFPSQEPLPKGRVSGFLPATLRLPPSKERANVAANLTGDTTSKAVQAALEELSCSHAPVHLVEMLACAGSKSPGARLHERLQDGVTRWALSNLALLSLRALRVNRRCLELPLAQLQLPLGALEALCDIVAVRNDGGAQLVSMRPFWAVAVLTAANCLPGREAAAEMLSVAVETILWCVSCHRFDLAMFMLSGPLPLWVRQFCDAAGCMEEQDKFAVAESIGDIVAKMGVRHNSPFAADAAKTQVALWIVLSKMERQLATYVPTDKRDDAVDGCQARRLRSSCRAVDYARRAVNIDASTQAAQVALAQSLLHLAALVARAEPQWAGIMSGEGADSGEWAVLKAAVSPTDAALRFVNEAHALCCACGEITDDSGVLALIDLERTSGLVPVSRPLLGDGEEFAEMVSLAGRVWHQRTPQTQD